MQRALAEALLLGAVAAVVSVFVVLRRLAFVSDVLTHTVFPGVVIGFVVAGTGGIVWGALVFAVLSAVLHHRARGPVPGDRGRRRWRSC